MKKFVGLLLLSFSILSSCSKSGGSETPPNQSAANEQPSMVCTMTDNSTVNVRDLTGKNILIFFQPDCDHCQREAADFQRNLESFQAWNIYFLTAAPIQEIAEFATTYKLNGQANVHFGFTPAKNILDNYGHIDAPSVYLYSEEHKMIKSFNGETEVSKIMSYL